MGDKACSGIWLVCLVAPCALFYDIGFFRVQSNEVFCTSYYTSISHRGVARHWFIESSFVLGKRVYMFEVDDLLCNNDVYFPIFFDASILSLC